MLWNTLLKVDEYEVACFLKRIPIFDWYVVW